MTSPGTGATSRQQRAIATALWNTIDRLAAEQGFTPSALARAAGLDPTALNPSRRVLPDGRHRLPRLETLFHLLDALGLSFSQFATLTGAPITSSLPATTPDTRHRHPGSSHLLRAVFFSRLGMSGLFDRAMLPVGRISARGWAEIECPVMETGPHDYAIRLDTDAYEPAFRTGSLLVLAPDAPVRDGDRVLLMTRPGSSPTTFPPALGLVRQGDTQRTVMLLQPDQPHISLPPGIGLHRIVAGIF